MKRDNIQNYSENVLSDSLCERIRHKLKLTEEQLPNSVIKKTTELSNELISDWIVNNADGYIPFKNCGNLVVSKYMPWFFREYKFESIEKIENDPKIPEWRKQALLRRFKEMQLTHDGKPKARAENMFYTFKIIWFNKVSCDFEKADKYQFVPTSAFKAKLVKKIKERKEYFEWRFEDFAKRGAESLSRKRRRNSPSTKEADKKLRELKNRKRGIK